MVHSITLPAPQSTTPRPAPPPGEKYCQCGCGEFLPLDSTFNYKRGHKKNMGVISLRAGLGGTDYLANSIAELRREISWREAHQKEIEQEVGTNRQKITLLRQSLQALQAIQGGGRPDGGTVA